MPEKSGITLVKQLKRKKKKEGDPKTFPVEHTASPGSPVGTQTQRPRDLAEPVK